MRHNITETRCSYKRRARPLCLLDGVGFAASRQRAATLVQSTRLGFLGPWPFRCEGSRSWGLDFLGFPWILSSEPRLINGLTAWSGETFYRAFALAARRAGTGACGLGMRKRRIVHRASLTWILIFCKSQIVVRTVPILPPQSKSRSPCLTPWKPERFSVSFSRRSDSL